MAESLARNRSLAEHCDTSGSLVQGIRKFDKHPLRDVKVGFSGFGRESVVPLEVRFPRMVGTSDYSEGCIGDPGRVPCDQNAAWERSEKGSPVDPKEVATLKFYPGPSSASNCIPRLANVIGVKVEAMHGDRMGK